MARLASCILIVFLALTLTGTAYTLSNLIPRKVLFGNPDRANVSVSPDGTRIAYLAPYYNVLNIYIADISNSTKGKLITHNRKRGVGDYFWAFDNKHIFYLQDNNGDENWHIHKIQLNTLHAVDITPFKGVRAYIAKASKKIPAKLIVGLNKNNSKYFDLYELDIKSGKLAMLYKNEQKLHGFLLDEDYRLRFAFKDNKDGGRTILEFDKAMAMKPFMKIEYEDVLTTRLIGLNNAQTTLYLTDSRDSDTSALFAYDLKTRTRKLIFHDSKSDIAGVLRHPTEKTLQVVYTNYLKETSHVLDTNIRKDIEFLNGSNDVSVMHIKSRDLKDRYWVITYLYDDKPMLYYLYDRKKMDLRFLFANRDDLSRYRLESMHPIVIKAKDGTLLVSYLSLPAQAATGKLVPLVLSVHGGPQSRISWGLSITTQWLVNRGYAVLSVNYRGSTGFGKSFINKGDREWGGKMQEDLLDAVAWAIDNKITSKDKVCIYGASYGGYAALVGLTFTPNVFACGVDVFGPSNLVTLLKSIPPYWAPQYMSLLRRVGGDPDTEDGRAFLASRSPITFAQRINKPLLIAQGANDVRVTQAESDQIVSAMTKHKIPVTYLLYTDEGHGFVRPENRLSFYAVMEQFLSKILGGLSEPIGNAFSGSSVKVRN